MKAFRTVFGMLLGALLFTHAAANVAQGQEAAQKGQSHPVCKDSSSGGYYPASAVINEKEGRVLLEYSVNGQGRATDVKILSEAPRGAFTRAAKTFIANLTCELPPGWSEKESSGRRYRLNMIFEFKPGGHLQPLSPKDPVFTVQAAKAPH